MEQEIELVVASGTESLKTQIQEMTAKKNKEGFKLTNISLINPSLNRYQQALLVFTKE